MKNLAGRVAVVTGGGSGIGLGMAEAFAAEGMSVVLADVDATRLEGAVERVERAGAAGTLAVPTDVGDPDAVQELARRAVDAFDAVHVLCNNAGVSAIGYLWQTPIEDWRWLLGSNVLGVVHGLQAFVPLLLEQDEAHVVNTASMAALASSPGMGAYIASKHAVVGLSKALRADLSTRWPHVGVSVICPGEVASNLADSVRTLGRPQDVARVDALRQRLGEAMPARDVGAIVVDAIRERRFWVLPNGEPHLDAVDEEIDELRADAGRSGR